MTTVLFRAGVVSAVLLALAITPAFAQSVVRGKVVDQDGNPVEGAVVVFDPESGSRTMESRTNRSGEFQQLGLPSDIYTVTASKEGVGTETVVKYQVQQRLNPVLEFKLVPEATSSGPDLTVGADGNRLPDEKIKQIQTAAVAAFQAMHAEEYDTAIQQFNAVLEHVPACTECHFNVAVAQANLGRVDEAEKGFLKVIELEPESADAYRGLASIYNALQRYEDAAKANEKAVALTGERADVTASAEAYYNQGVILWNNRQAQEAKVQFERAAAADPTMAMPHYYIGLANVNLGQLAEARAAFEKYLELEPDGEKAGEAKGMLGALPR